MQQEYATNEVSTRRNSEHDFSFVRYCHRLLDCRFMFCIAANCGFFISSRWVILAVTGRTLEKGSAEK